MNKKCASKLFMLILIVLFSITGCTTKIKTAGPFDSDKNLTGFKYYLPTNILTVEATKKTTTTNSLNDCLEIVSETKITYDIKPLVINIIPDFKKTYTVEIKHGPLSADTIAIKRTEKQLLKKISVDSIGKTADVAVNTLKAVASIAGAAYGLNIAPFFPKQIPGIQPSLSPLLKRLETEYSQGLCNWKDILKQKGINNPDELTNIQAFTLINNDIARGIFKKIEEKKLIIDSLENQRNMLYKELLEAKSDGDAKVKREKVKDNEDYIAIIKLDLERYTLALNILVQNISEEIRIGKNEITETIKEIFKVDDLPTTASLSESLVGKEISDSFNRLGFAISIDWLNISESDTQNSADAETNSVATNSNQSYIYYRDSIPALLTIYNRDNKTIKYDKKGNSVSGIVAWPWKPYQKSTEMLFAANSKASRVTYKTSYVGKRKIVLDFTDSGILTDISFESTASADILAEKASQGVTESISSFSTALDSIRNIQLTKASIISSQLESRLNTLQSQKEILDAEIALKGAYADVDLLKKQAHLKNQLEYYESLSESIKAGNSAAVAEAMSEINIETGKLSAISEYINALKGASASSIENITQIQALKEQIIGLQSQIVSNPDSELLQTQIETLQLQLTILQKLLEVQQSKLN